MTAFDEAFAYVLKREGGYVNDPQDNGGETNLGVTRKAWIEWSGDRNPNMRALTVFNVKPFYKRRYWDMVGGDLLPPALALALFDFGVNAGPGRAVKMLQKIVGASADGSIGPATLKAVQAYAGAKTLPEIIRQFTIAKKAYYCSLDDFPRFGKGWLGRCDETETECLRLCK
jgi:lysozyme family protein